MLFVIAIVVLFIMWKMWKSHIKAKRTNRITVVTQAKVVAAGNIVKMSDYTKAATTVVADEIRNSDQVKATKKWWHNQVVNAANYLQSR